MLFIVATGVVPICHAPPVAVLINWVESLGQIVVIPVMIPAFGRAFTVSTKISFINPQALLSVYEIVAVPGLIPITVQLLVDTGVIVALGELLLQVPPVFVSVSKIPDPAQTLLLPVIEPSAGV